MTNLSRLFLVFLLAYLSFLPPVHALLFERRKTPEPEISWFVYPVVGSIPGVQDFYGLGTTVSSIGGTDSDITAVSLRGKAEYFDEDFKIDILAIFDLPLFQTTSPLPGAQQKSVTPDGLKVNGE